MKEILQERRTTHGDFEEVAHLHQKILDIYYSSINWEKLSSTQKTVLQMDAMKTARILCGNYNHTDSWLDKSGYALLAAQELGYNLEEKENASS